MNDGTWILLTRWHAHPEVLIGIVALEVAYLLAVGPLRKRWGLADEADPRQTATFTSGVVVLFLALISPIHELSDNYLFSAHMFQHILLTLVAPPLLIMGIPAWLVRPLLRPKWALRLARIGTHPLVAFALFNLVFSLWHMPALYNVSVTNHDAHIAEHIMFIATGLPMWWPIVSRVPELPRLSYPLRMGYLFLLSVAQIIVFAPIAFSQAPIYQFYMEVPRIWGISPLVDQQIGAVIMKVGGGLLLLTLFVITFFRWAAQEDRKRGTDIGAQG